MKEQSTSNVLKNAAGISIGLSVLMIVLGFLAIWMPFVAGIGVSVLLSWIIIVGGFVHLGYAFAAQGVGSFLWRTLIGIVYIIGGFYLLLNPGLALATFTFAVAIILISEAIIQIIGFFQLRSLPGSGWILVDGIVTLLLGILIAYPWPGSSSWAIGTLVGVNLILSGFSRLMYSAATRNVIKATAS